MLALLLLSGCADTAPVLLPGAGFDFGASPFSISGERISLKAMPGETLQLSFEAEDAEGDPILFWWAYAPLGWEQHELGGPDVTWQVSTEPGSVYGALILEGVGPEGSLHSVYDAEFEVIDPDAEE